MIEDSQSQSLASTHNRKKKIMSLLLPYKTGGWHSLGKIMELIIQHYMVMLLIHYRAWHCIFQQPC